MTPKEYAEATRALQKDIGPRAEISTFFTSDYLVDSDKYGVLSAYIYPEGISRDRASTKAHADTLGDLFNRVQAAWAEHKAAFREKSIRKLALDIIRITAETGACTEAALRTAGYSQEIVARYGAEACEEANRIGGLRPFLIETTANDNGAPNEPDALDAFIAKTGVPF